MRNWRNVQKHREAHGKARGGIFSAYRLRVCNVISDYGMQHLAFVRGDVSGADPVLVRVHSECLTGDVFGSTRCDCGTQLDDGLATSDSYSWS